VSTTLADQHHLDIVPLTQERFRDLAALFEQWGDARWCWCQFWRKPGSNWSNTTADENRADLERLVSTDTAPGLVALRDGQAVGWVGLGPREAFGRLERSRTIPRLPGDGVWSINCFVVARTARRSGVGGSLLAAAIDYARAHGASILEGYPVKTTGSRIPSASVYTGTLGMFERAGFEIAAETTSKASGGTPRVVVRLTT
jgi:GNAT superfamily N-acetyltransferase